MNETKTPNQFQWQCEKCRTVVGRDYSKCPICALKTKEIPMDKKEYRIAIKTYSDKEKEIIRKHINHLNQQESQIIRMRTGLNGSPPKSLRFVGEIMGLSQGWVKAIEKGAFKKIFNKNTPVLNEKA